MHVARAMTGDAASVEWLVRRISPALLVQAEYRLGRTLRRLHDPEDVVNDVWLAALPKLGSLVAAPGRHVPALVAYLSTALLHRVGRLQQRWLHEKRAASVGDGASNASTPSDPPADATSAISRAIRNEHGAEVQRAIAGLGDQDREILVLRGIEQHTAAEVAAVIGLTANAVNVRFHRALGRLREAVADSVFSDLGV